jgi:hypothetical protein
MTYRQTVKIIFIGMQVTCWFIVFIVCGDHVFYAKHTALSMGIVILEVKKEGFSNL